MKALSGCDPPLSATADTQPPHALLSMHCQHLPGDTGGQAADATWLGQVLAKDASAPREEKLTSQLAAMKLEGTARGLAPLSLPSQACVLRRAGEKKTCGQFTVSLSNSTTSVSHSIESVSMAESCELWAISCRNRASFSNWDSICSLQTKRESWQRPSGRQSIPAKSTGKRGGPCPSPSHYAPAS